MIYNTILLKDEIIGYMINIGDTQHAIVSEGLMVKDVFKQLMEEGYHYFGNGIFEDKKGININTYESIDFYSLPKEEQNDFYCIGEVYTDNDSEVINYISHKPPKSVEQFKTAENPSIHTREELIAFLNTSIEIDDPRSYMPLNSFVAAEALFTIEDITVTKDFNTVKSLIEQRQQLTFTQMELLIKALGCSFESKPIDILEAYYSWGIPGIRAELFGKRIYESDKIILPDGSIAKTVALDKISLPITTTGKPIVTPPDGYTLYTRNDVINERLATLKSDEVVIVEYAKNTLVKRLEFTFEKFSVNIVPGLLVVLNQYNYGILNMSTPKVYYPTGGFIEQDKLNVTNPKVVEELNLAMTVDALTTEYFKKIYHKTDVSTYKLLRNLGCSEMRAVRIVLDTYNQELQEDKMVLKTNNELQEEMALVENTLQNINELYEKSEDDFPAEEYRELISKVKTGDINTGEIAKGVNYDKSFNPNLVASDFYNAIKYMNIMPDKISEAISHLELSVEKPDDCIVLSNGKYRLSIPARLRIHALQAYTAELKRNILQAPTDAPFWLYVTEVFSEPRYNYSRHVGVKCFLWKHINDKGRITYPQIENAIEDILPYSVTNINNPIDKEEIKQNRIIITSYIAKVIFFCLAGKGNTLKIGTESITIPEDLKEDIKLNAKVGYIGTHEITFGMMADINTTRFYVYNCLITPYWVYPKLDDIPVVSIYCAWNYGQDNPAFKTTMLEKNYLLPENGPSLRSPGLNVPRQIWTSNECNYDLKSYCSEYIDVMRKYVNDIEHPYDLEYPGISPTEYPQPNSPKIQQVYYITKNESVQEKNTYNPMNLDWSNDLIDVLNTNIINAEKPINHCSNFTYKEFRVFPDIKTIADALTSAHCSKVKVIQYLNNTLYFSDGSSCKNYEVPGLDTDIYAVFPLSGNVYVAVTASGINLKITL